MNSTPTGSAGLLIRHCQSHGDLEACVRLQREIWGFRDEDLTPAAILTVAQHTGGLVLYALEGSIPAGFALAFSADDSGRRYWHSHMTGVLPAYQNQGLGRMLKLRQREEALRAGVTLIKWTFDPLELRNAHFNITKLGVTARQYIPNCYGVRPGAMDNSLPTDRLLCEWPLDSPRVVAAINGLESAPHREGVEVAVPSQLSLLKQTDPSAVRSIQANLNSRFADLFQRGYSVTGFARGPETCRYILERYED